MQENEINPEACVSIEEIQTYIHFNDRFEKEMGRPLTDKEKAFLSWLSKEHIKRLTIKNISEADLWEYRDLRRIHELKKAGTPPSLY
ncbi:MAG TPA: hypothetical protein VF149_00700 [Bacillales bacterium]